MILGFLMMATDADIFLPSLFLFPSVAPAHASTLAAALPLLPIQTVLLNPLAQFCIGTCADQIRVGLACTATGK
jgi:hypothetical protein